MNYSSRAKGKLMKKNIIQDKPNILFILSDQQRWDAVSCYEEPIFPNLTPNIDKMAEEGVRFENTFTAQPVCGPTRACLQTGKYATENKCFRNEIGLLPEEKTIAHWMSEAGYEVGYIGKWHLASNKIVGRKFEDYWNAPVPQHKRGGYKDYWLASDVLEFTSHSYDGYMFDAENNKREFEKGRYRADVLTDWTIEYLKLHRDKEKPFFMFLSFIEPHHQNDHHQYEGPIGSKEKFNNYVIPGDLIGKEGDWEKELPDYLGCCNALDNNVGRLRQTLDELNLTENTIVIYVSDHGSHFRTRNDEYKRSCHDSSIRVPLIINGPGFKGGKVIDEMVSLMDLPPTLLKAGGINVPKYFKGKPLQNILDGNTIWPEEIFLQISESQVGRAIRTKKYKYSVVAPDKDGWNDPDSDQYMDEYLYDLENDKFEKNNLISDSNYYKIRLELREILIRRMVEAGEKEPQILDANSIAIKQKVSRSY